MSNPNPNGIQPYSYPASQADEFEKKGHPGMFLQSITCPSGSTTTFTGSNYGIGGLIVAYPTTGTASLSLGGEIPLATLATMSSQGAIIEISVRRVTVLSGGPVYALIRNQLVR